MNGFSGLLSIVKQELEPRVVYNHPLRRVLGISIKWDSQPITIFNVHAPNSPKERAKIWRDLADLEIEGVWCIMGDFNMVDLKKDSKGTSAVYIRNLSWP